MLIFLLTSCFRGFISGQIKYQATEYVVDSPRIVALKASSINMIGGAPVQFDALLLSPQGTEVTDWIISSCGLGNETQTFIWDFSCFEDQEEISILGNTNSMPLSVGIPDLPEIIECDDDVLIDEDSADTGKDTGFFSKDADCSHYLPIRFEAKVDQVPVYAAGFLSWFPFVEEDRVETRYDVPMNFLAPSIAKAGETVDLSFYFIPKPTSTNMESTGYHWYIDAGELLRTGLTASTDVTWPSIDYPLGKIGTSNQLIIPEDYHGTLRVWVVIHQSRSEGLDMNWKRWDIEVE